MVQRHGGLSGSRPNSLVHGVLIEILTPFCKNFFYFYLFIIFFCGRGALDTKSLANFLGENSWFRDMRSLSGSELVSPTFDSQIFAFRSLNFGLSHF